jgi:hypothetical protein
MKQPAIPKTAVKKTKLPSLEFNAGEIISRYFTIWRIIQHIDAQDKKDLILEEQFYRGLKQGYEDWFNCLHFTPADVRDVYDRLSVEQRMRTKEDAQIVIKKILESKGVPHRLVIPSASVSDVNKVIANLKKQEKT